MLNTIQNRILLALAALLLAFAIGFYFVNNWERKNITVAVKSFEEQHRNLLRSVVVAQGSNAYSFSTDFSQWDELLSNLQEKDTLWFDQNVTYALPKYGLSYVWIYDSSFNLFYSKSISVLGKESLILPDKGQLTELTAGNRFPHFFLKGKKELMEVFAAPVQLQSDSARTSTPMGWLFAGKEWSDSLLYELSQTTSSELMLDTSSLVSDLTKEPKEDISRVKVSLVLEGWSGRPIGLINSYAKVLFIEEYQASYRRFMIISFIMVIFILLAISIILFRFVQLPLSYLNKTLEFRDMKFLEPLRYQKDAFGQLSENIIQLFRKETLLQEVEKRKRLESQLLQSENRYRLLVENIPDVLWICNEKGDLVYISPNSYSILGYYPDEVIGKEDIWAKLIHPDDYHLMMDNFQRFILQDTQYQSEYRLYHKEGHVIWVAEKAISKFEFDGTRFSCGRMSDITSEKQLKQQLYDSEQEYKTLFKQNPYGVVVVTLNDYRFKEANQAFIDLIGYSFEELIGKTIADITPAEDLEKEMQLSRKAREEGKDVFSLEKQLIRKNGEIIWIILTVSYIIDQEGHRVLGCGVIEDITHKKKIQDTLTYEHNMLVSLMENVPDLIFFKDINGRYINANNATVKMIRELGYADPIGKTDEEIFANSNFFENIKNDDKQVLTTGLPIINKEEEIHSKSGETFWFLASKIPIIFGADKRKMLVGILRDITGQKQTEIKLRQYAKELKESNISKDKFLSILAHDLKNPFNAILGFSSVLAEEYDDYTEKERKHFVFNIHQAAENTFNLIQNILEWTRSQTGRIALNPAMNDFSAVVNETYKLLRPAMEKKNIRFLSSVPFNTMAWFDENMMKTVLRNLISNAVKFSHGSGSVSVYCRVVNPDLIEVCIEDQGLGIPEDAISRLFKIDDSYRREGTLGEQGTGLGLILCKEFIERNNGMIWISSQEGKGSKFFFTLPRSSAYSNAKA